MSDVVATRFPRETIDELDAVARERRRTRAEIVREAVDVYLTRWADYAIALDRLHDPTDEVVEAPGIWMRPRDAACARPSTTAWPRTRAAASASPACGRPAPTGRCGASAPETTGSSTPSVTLRSGYSWCASGTAAAPTTISERDDVALAASMLCAPAVAPSLTPWMAPSWTPLRLRSIVANARGC